MFRTWLDFVEFECVCVGYRDINPLVSQIVDVLVPAIAHDRQNAKVLTIVERLREFDGKRMKVPSKKPPAMPTVQLLTWADLPLASGDRVVAGREAACASSKIADHFAPRMEIPSAKSPEAKSASVSIGASVGLLSVPAGT